MLASTWNVELARERGECIGEELIFNNLNGWYGPGANTHRSAFGGRNNEYFSEDGLLAGKMLAAECSGAESKGVMTYTKHFAFNDQEANRNSVLCTWVNEQAAREIYLKGFEICAKEAVAEVNEVFEDHLSIHRISNKLMSPVYSYLLSVLARINIFVIIQTSF